MTVEGRTLAQQYAAEATGRLVHWMRSDDPNHSIPASKEILARAFGRPAQELLVGPNGVPLQPPNFRISMADGGPGQHRRLPDDPVEAARAYHDFMNGVPYDGVEYSPAASPPTPLQPAALAAPAAIAPPLVTNTAPQAIAARR